MAKPTSKKSPKSSSSGTDGRGGGRGSAGAASRNAPRASGVQVGIVMGSESDLRVMQLAADCLKDFGVAYEVRILSAHRTPNEMLEYAATAEDRGLKVLIAGAGGAAHLPGMIASATVLPVIGVPVNITALDGFDAFLSIVQMPKGVPVATVAIDNATNAALLATRILATSDRSVSKKLHDFRRTQAAKVKLSDAQISGRNSGASSSARWGAKSGASSGAKSRANTSVNSKVSAQSKRASK